MSNFSFKQWAPFVILMVVAVLSLFVPLLPNFDEGKYSAAEIAFVLIAAALVFLMTPGLAFFYGGMVHRKNVLSTMIKSVVAAGVITVLWTVVGFSLAFGDTIGGFIGNPKTYLFFQGLNSGPAWGTIP
jgi:Amt family ammonium transporter